MYGCCNVRKFLKLLLIDAIVIVIGGMLFAVGKAFHTNADEPVRLPVIMYHSIYTNLPSEYAVTPEQVNSDLQWLSANGYKSVTAQQVIDYTRNMGELPEKAVMITLDDGFYNNLSVLVPLLEKYDMTALISVVGSYTENNAVKDPHEPKYSYLTWEDIRELYDSGRIEFGNHTYNMHALHGERVGCSKNDGESEEVYRSELSADLLQLQSGFRDNIGIEPVVFAYPFGKFSRESLPVIRDCGFLMTLTCREQPNYITREPDCLYGINRYNRSGLYSTEEFMQMIMESGV